MPVLGIITKARSDEEFRAEVQRLLPEARNVVRVRAIAETLDDGHTLEPMGLDDLIEATLGLLPDGKPVATSGVPGPGAASAGCCGSAGKVGPYRMATDNHLDHIRYYG